MTGFGYPSGFRLGTQGFPAGGGTPAFSPSDVTGLYQWLKSSSLSLADNDPVSTWADSSGNGRDATQGTGANQPTYKTNIVNSQPVVRFDGSNDYLSLGALNALTAGEVFIVIKLDADPPAIGQGGFWKMGQSSDNVHVPFSDNNIYDDAGSTVRRAAGDPGNLAAWCIYSVVSTGSEWTGYFNGVQFFTTGTNTVGFAVAGYLGTDNPASARFLDGDVAEYILYDNKLSAGDRTSVIAYLKDAYGIA